MCQVLKNQLFHSQVNRHAYTYVIAVAHQPTDLERTF